MNYETNIKYTYHFELDNPVVNSAIALFSGGTKLNVPSFTGVTNYDNICEYVSNYALSNNDDYGSFTGFVYFADTGIFVISSNTNDYAMVKTGFYTTGVVGAGYSNNQNQSNLVYYDINDLAWASNYPKYTSLNGFNSFTYGSYDVNLSSSSQSQYTIFDYSNLYYSDLTRDEFAYIHDVYLIRQRQGALYNTCLSLYNLNGNGHDVEFDISFGSPYQDIYNERYQAGYTMGENIGYENGKADGIEIGKTINSTGIGEHTADAFDYLGKAFESASSILALEIIPHVTLGLCFTIPFAIAMISLIFRLVKK